MSSATTTTQRAEYVAAPRWVMDAAASKLGTTFPALVEQWEADVYNWESDMTGVWAPVGAEFVVVADGIINGARSDLDAREAARLAREDRYLSFDAALREVFAASLKPGAQPGRTWAEFQDAVERELWLQEIWCLAKVTPTGRVVVHPVDDGGFDVGDAVAWGVAHADAASDAARLAALEGWCVANGWRPAISETWVCEAGTLGYRVRRADV